MDNISIKKLDWFEPDLKGKYDIICGSELIYKIETVDPVIGVLQKYLRPDGRAFIAHDVRRINMMQFIEKLENVFNHTGRIKTLRGDGEIHKINLLEIRLK